MRSRRPAPARALALAAAAALSVGLLVVAGPAPSAGQGASTGSEAFTRLASCLTDARRLLVLLLVDTSGSLRETDPSAQRVVAARVALSGLEALSRSSGVAVEVQLAGFSVGYEPVGAWTALTPESLGAMQASVDGFALRTTGIDTDYYAALRGAHRQLEERTAALAGPPGAPPCQAVLWFTDGQYDIVDRLTPEARQAGLTKDYAPEVSLDRPGAGAAMVALGRERLCGATPLIDDLRRGGASLFFIALTTRIDPGALDFMDALTTGGAGAVQCGREGSVRTGARLDAANLGDLLAAFDRAASEIGRGVREPGPAETAVCPGAACAQGRRTFDLDDTIRRFHLLAVMRGEGVALEVQGPAGAAVAVPPGVSGSGAAGEVPVRWQWASPTAVTLDGDHPAGDEGWDGEWTVTFVDPAGRPGSVARTQIYLFGDVVPTLLAPTELEAGRTARLRIGAVSERDPAAARRVADATLEASVEDPATGEVTPLGPGRRQADGTFTARYRVPADAVPGERVVTLRLLARTRKGVALAPAERAVRLPVRVLAYPAVTLAADRLPPVTGRAPGAEAEVVVAADRRSAACVWLAGASVEGPAAAGTFAVRGTPETAGAGDCLAVAAGETARLRVTIRPEGAAEGRVDGALRVAAVADLNPEARETSLPFGFEMTRPVDAARRLVVFLALMVAGVVPPLLTGVSVGRWRVARAGGLSLGFPRWAWSRTAGRGGAAVWGWGLSIGGWARSRRPGRGWGTVPSWFGRVGGWAQTKLPGGRAGAGPGEGSGAGRRPSRAWRAGDDLTAPGLAGVDEFGVPLAGDAGRRDRIHVSVLLDRSESMTPLVHSVVEGCNAFLAVHRAEPGPARLTLAQFDLQDPLEILLDGVDLAQAPDLTLRQFRPRGVTPLYDAIGALLDRTEAEARQRAAAGLPAEDQLVVVLTDGRDNASSRWGRNSIANRIRALEARGWTFVFLGANMDAFAEGAALGIAAGSTSDFAATGAGVRKAFAAVSRATLAHRRKASAERAADRLDFFRGAHRPGADGGRRPKARR